MVPAAFIVLDKVLVGGGWSGEGEKVSSTHFEAL